VPKPAAKLGKRAFYLPEDIERVKNYLATKRGHTK
jgi:hypothetical protein